MSDTSKDGAEKTAAPVKVHMNNHAANVHAKFPDNFIRTSRYNVLTFLPLNLFHQFRKISNFYFLINMVVSLVPGVSPVSPFTAILPLVFVVGVALAKDGYEDFLRHKADNRANSIEAHVLREGKFVPVESRDVQVGDVMRIENGEEVRADVLLLCSSGTECSAFIDTCNLDGETNLKGRKAVEATWGLNSEAALEDAELNLITGQPSPALLHWAGVLTLGSREVAVGLDQFMYRSCVLKNTEWAYGVVLYAGIHTKMFQNLQEKPPKSSNLDKKLNQLIIVVVITQVLLILFMSIMAVVFNNEHDGDWYLDYFIDDRTGFLLWLYRLMTYFILMSYMVPISLFVTIELCKVAQGKLMSWDQEMMEWMNGKWTSCVPNTTDLNEQLAHVKFIFSDKTGTLTENVMKYKQGDICGLPVHSDDWDMSKKYFKESEDKREAAMKYFKALALCHTIQPFPDPHGEEGDLMYDGASPDEVALVDTAKEHLLELIERTTRSMTLNVFGEKMRYEIMATLEFTPDRKMMSIVVREPDGKIILYTKGADSFVMPRLDAAANAETLPTTLETLKELAILGLRTLLVCRRELTQEIFDKWYARFEDAGKALEDRSAKVDQVCLELEDELVMIGATAIEDKLQDKVPETLRFFLDAKVIIWMLTGDKRETAVTIAATSSLANPMTDYIDHIDIGSLDHDTKEASDLVLQQLRQVEQHIKEGSKRVTFVCDGPALNIAMADHFELFLEISQHVNSAVCCRLTPIQKANVVDMFQTATGATALAIGDGANDVSMIQKGRVGVGIVGLEGAQAALAADYAIPRFKHLRRLCCVHGRYAVHRNALCICFSFYKNMMLAMVQFYFAIFCGWSGTSLIDGWLLSFYNFAFTSVPPLLLGFFDKDIAEEPLMLEASLFPPLAEGLYFDIPTLARWFGESFLHSIGVFFILYPTMENGDFQGKKGVDVNLHGTLVIMVMIFLVLCKLMIHVKYWMWVQVAGFAFSFILAVLFAVIYSAVPNLFGITQFYFSIFMWFADVKFWLYMLLFLVGGLIPVDVAVMFLQRQLFPTKRDEVQMQYTNTGFDADV